MKYKTVEWLAYSASNMFIGSFKDKDCALDWAKKHNGYIDKHTTEHDENRIYDSLLRKDEREKCKAKYEAKIARLTEENERLKEQTKDFEVLYAGIKNGEVDMSVRGTTLKAITACFIQAFIQNGGTNFFLYDLQDDDGNKYSVTIQKEAGKTPAEMLHESKAENAELKARLEKAVILPCNVGDTIYEILVSVHREWIVNAIKIFETGIKIDAQEKSSGAHWYFDLKDYNQTWFTDRAKAEACLAELKRG